MRSTIAMWLFLFALTIPRMASSQDRPVEPASEDAQVEPGGDFSTNTHGPKVPVGVILVKGAWSSASDSVTPVPENGRVIAGQAYTNPYFSLAYPLSPDLTEKHKGPPPSPSGYYVLGQFGSSGNVKEEDKGLILIAAQDLFFSSTQIRDAMQMVQYNRSHLDPEYRVETQPTELRLGNRSFVRFGYMSPVAGLHWSVMATRIRCHAVEFIFTSRSPKVLLSWIDEMKTMVLPPDAGETSGPVCIKDYARKDNLIEKVDPAFTEHRFNPVPVRIIIDKSGRVKHIHFLSAFPDQEKAISDALSQWRFKPYLNNGQPREVETGIMFGRIQRQVKISGASPISD